MPSGDIAVEQEGNAEAGPSNTSRGESVPSDGGRPGRKGVNPACAYCHGSKMKCQREAPGESCRRCRAAGIECVVLERQARKRRESSAIDPRPTQRLSNQRTPLQQLPSAQPAVPQITEPLPSSTVVAEPLHEGFLPMENERWSGDSSHLRDYSVGDGPMQGPLDLVMGSESGASPGKPSPQTATTRDEDRDTSQTLPGDPLVAGVLSEREARVLHEWYWSHLQALSTMLDPEIDTFESTRSRSPLLFSSICASAVRFIADSAALSIRLDRHVKMLVAEAFTEGPASLEFVQALLIMNPWLPTPGTELGDLTSRYLALAISTYREVMAHERRANFQPPPRHLRARQRLLLVLYQFDAGFALVTGRPSTLGADRWVQDAETWCNLPLALPTDEVLASLVALRRDMSASIVTRDPQTASNLENMGPSTIKGISDDLFASWESKWLVRPSLASNAYVELVRHHSELSFLMFAMSRKHLARSGPPRVLMAACLEAASKVCITTVKLLPSGHVLVNNSVVMIVYAALVMLKLMELWPLGSDYVQLLRNVSGTLATWGTFADRKGARSLPYSSQLTRAIDATCMFQMPPVDGPAAAANGDEAQHSDPALLLSLASARQGVSEFGDGTTSRGEAIDWTANGGMSRSDNFFQFASPGDQNPGLAELLFDLLPRDNDAWHPWLENMIPANEGFNF